MFLCRFHRIQQLPQILDNLQKLSKKKPEEKEQGTEKKEQHAHVTWTSEATNDWKPTSSQMNRAITACDGLGDGITW